MAAVSTPPTQRRQSADWRAANIAADARTGPADSSFLLQLLAAVVGAAGAGVGNFGCLIVLECVLCGVFLNLGPLLQEFPIVEQIWGEGGGEVKFM
jgi:hypothetical protein